tara:strand:- start:190 stop:459 length:270 start_codon:yes stop_codon:yes gene_type:complete
METIVMTQTNLTKNPNTKTTYLVEKENTEEITPTQYRNITSNDTLKWFRRLGGSETAERSYTCRGYNITTLTSTSPNKQSKTIRQFKFN